MDIKKYAIKLTGTAPMLLHQDDVEWSDQMKDWLRVPANKKNSSAGDDRSPAFRWIGSLYRMHTGDVEVVCVPSDNLMSCLREGGALVGTGNKNSTFKAATQTGMRVLEIGWPIYTRVGKLITCERLPGLMKEPDFAVHKQVAGEMGCPLFVKRARVGQSKHIRVRPMIEMGWTAEGTMAVTDERIKKDVLTEILFQCGVYRGLCDWRPGSKTPGPYGTFSVEVKAL